MTISVNTKFNYLDDLARNLKGNVNGGLAELGEQIYGPAYDATAFLSGNLRDGLFVEVDDGVLTVGYQADYAPDVELGNATREAQPALTPAFDAVATQENVAGMIADKIQDSLG